MRPSQRGVAMAMTDLRIGVRSSSARGARPRWRWSRSALALAWALRAVPFSGAAPRLVGLTLFALIGAVILDRLPRYHPHARFGLGNGHHALPRRRRRRLRRAGARARPACGPRCLGGAGRRGCSCSRSTASTAGRAPRGPGLGLRRALRHGGRRPPDPRARRARGRARQGRALGARHSGSCATPSCSPAGSSRPSPGRCRRRAGARRLRAAGRASSASSSRRRVVPPLSGGAGGRGASPRSSGPSPSTSPGSLRQRP